MQDNTERYDKIAGLYEDPERLTQAVPVGEEAIAAAEQQLGVTFPASYRWFLAKYGVADWPDYIYGLCTNPLYHSVVETTIANRTTLHPHIPDAYIPFAPDGGGNHYCLKCDELADGECPIIFWDHDCGEDQEIDVTHDSFLSWLEETIENQFEFEEEDTK
jgi:cell wall assembly regulator SMI1